MFLVENSEFKRPPEAPSTQEEPLFVHRRGGNVQNRKLLVFVHGLGGDRYGTWENGKDENYRRRSFPRFIFEEEKALRDADIGLYAYVTGMKRLVGSSINLGSEATVMADTLRDALNYSHLILIGHSMGGMLIKAAVAELIERRDHVTLERICGLFLLATPQLGSLRVPPWFPSLFNKDFRALKPNSTFVEKITKTFNKYVLPSAPNKEDASKFVIPAWAVVAAEDFWVYHLSAGLAIPEERCKNVRGWHTRIVKPKHKNEEAYKWVVNNVAKCFRECPRPLPPKRSDIKHMPDPLAPRIKLIGRENDYKRLKRTYRNTRGSVLCVHGPMGSGKTFLMSTFVNTIASRRRDKATVFWWVFPSKASDNSPPFSSTGFFADALRAFGHEGEFPKKEEKLAERLAELLREHKSLLVLDQVENLQQPSAEHGKITDTPLSVLLRDLAQGGLDSGGLVLVGSRYALADLQLFKSYLEIELKPLEDQFGAALLREQGVHDRFDNLLISASSTLGGNPLALLLCGSLLIKKFNGDVRRFGQLESCIKGARGEEHARKVIEEHNRYLCDDDRTFLQLLGLFGRKMEEEDLKVLLDSKAGRSLARLKPEELNEMYSRLSDYTLLSGKDEETDRWDKWDTHPLMRQYFGEQLRESGLAAWHDAHRVLFENYSKQAERFSTTPDLAELTAMFDVVRHGCLAEQYVDAYKFYRDRIAQDWKGYDTEVRGAVSEALNAVSSFFDGGSYQKPVEELGNLDNAWLLARASYCLESQGKLRDAVAPREASNSIYKELHSGAQEASYEAFERVRDTAFGFEELAGIQMRLGKLDDAEKTSQEAVHWANKAAECETRSRSAGTWVEPKQGPDHMPPVPPWLRRCSTLSALGAVLHRRGKLNDAQDKLEEARTIHAEHVPVVLHSEPGVRYCMLQLDRARTMDDYRAVLKHANKMLDWSNRSPHATEIIKGLHCLIKGLALMELGRYDDKAQEPLDDAVQLIRDSNKIQFLCDPLLARATFWRLKRDVSAAQRDVKEVLDISKSCGMRLYQADGYLLHGHIELDLANDRRAHESRAHEDLKKARRLIFSNYYNLRIAELHLLEARLKHSENTPKEKEQCLRDAEENFKSMGYWRLRRQWTRYKNGRWDI